MIGYLLFSSLCGSTALSADQAYLFDASSFHKKTWEFGGYLELKGEHLELDSEAAFYKLRFLDEPRETVDRSSGALELEARYRKGILSSWARTHSSLQKDYLGEEQTHKLFEAVLSLQPDPSRMLDLGKQVNRWGKGYAWNPVGFIERPKTPDDPTLSREGFWMLRGEWIRSFSGPLTTLAVTLALVPTINGVNKDFGKPEQLNPAAKLYLLYRDMDLDFLYLSQGSRSARFGIDFAKNLADNFEIHGEVAHLTDSERRLVTPAGIITESHDAVSYLLGMRYLTPQDITIVAEYYENGTGYSAEENRAFYRQVHLVSEENDKRALSSLILLSKSAYGRPNPGRQYMYLRASWKEPVDILYFTPSITSIVNLEDRSFSLIPEFLYRGVDNMELRLRLNIAAGDPLSEYGEKQTDYRLDLRLRCHF